MKTRAKGTQISSNLFYLLEDFCVYNIEQVTMKTAVFACDYDIDDLNSIMLFDHIFQIIIVFFISDFYYQNIAFSFLLDNQIRNVYQHCDHKLVVTKL